VHFCPHLCTPRKTSRSITHPKIALGQARLTMEFFTGGLPKKKVYLVGMSILSILLSLESGCHNLLPYPVFMPKPTTHRMHDPGSIVPHIQRKVFIDNQMPRVKYNYYYINSVSIDYDDSQRNRITEDSITPEEQQPGQHVTYNSSSKNSSPSSPSEQQV
jgi:hypothetical protein